MSTAESPEARELSLVSKVEMRIAMTSSDGKLQSVLETYLPPLLLKLASEFVSVRNKVITVCQHINTRIKPPSIKLPVATLLKQYKESKSSLVRHFDLLYIQQGFDRLSRHEHIDLLPQILHGLEANYQESATNAASIFNIFLRLLHRITFPPRGSEEDLALRDKLGLADRPADAIFVATWLGKLIQFSINQPATTRCPGLSKDDCSFLQMHGKGDTWNPQAAGGLNLIETKALAIRFLASGAFIDTERFLPSLFASADPNSRISDVGVEILKRATSAVSFEDPALIKQLYEIYLGTRGPEGSLPARIPLKIRILSMLCKSKLASSFIPQSTQIVQEALTPAGNAPQNGEMLTPKQGLEATKLRAQVFAFTNWLARISTPAELSGFAPALVGDLRRFIEDQGWPRYDTNNDVPVAAELASRAYGYESIGILAGSCPEKLLLDPNLDLLRWLFTSLSQDSGGKDISASIEQALSIVLGAIGSPSGSDFQVSLTSLLLHYMNLSPEDPDTHIVKGTQYLAVRFANRCLPFSNVTARWMDICAMEGDANERSAVLEEGRKGLDPYWYRMLNPTKDDIFSALKINDAAKYHFPSFPELVDKIFGAESIWNVSGSAKSKLNNAYVPALTFCRCILLHEALTAIGSPPIVDVNWERNIDALVANDEDVRGKLKVYFRDLSISQSVTEGASKALKIYLQAAFIGLIRPHKGDASRPGDYLLELCSLSPNSTYVDLSTKILSLQVPVFSTSKLLRDRSSHLFGVLASLEECSKIMTQTMLKVFEQKLQIWQQANGERALQVHGATLAIGYLLSRLWVRNNQPPDFDNKRSRFITSMFDILSESRDKMLLEAVFTALSELALFGVLKPETVPKPPEMSTILLKITEKAKEGNERAMIALGHFAIQCHEDQDEGALLNEIIEKLHDLHTVRQPEAQFAVGDALSCAAIGWQSKSLVAALDVQSPPPLSPARSRTLSTILNQVLSDCKSTKPALRQASVIWLLCLVQNCGHHPDLHNRLRECQVAFKGFLADRDSLNQESASRGLTLVYEKGNRALKNDLIRDLVGSFTETKANFAGTVSQDTELFDPGALPTGEGSITTYKDIMSLAAEVGDSSLVYKFMSLASNNAIWSSRAAFGRFGLSNILSDASTEGYLAQNPKLYSALFRYRFDPNTNVRKAMNDIWIALVKEPSKTVDHHFDAIMNDLLRNALGKEWRARQASCAAIADLVQGRQLEKYEKFLTEIWEVTFKVCDDIKDSVRAAAMALAQVLTGILTRTLESAESSSRSSEKMLKQVLPFLLSPAGLESGAPDVQNYSRKALLEIIKSSNGQTLRPFVPDLVGRLLALLSSIEPEMINYLHLNADQYGLTAQELDDARLKHIRGSRMLEAIERCLDFLDESSMPALQQSLENAIKTVIGLPSKVGCSRVLVSLSTRQNFIFKPYANHFLSLARKQVFDPNDTISSSYAVACGYVARLSADEALHDLVRSCHKLYFDPDEERHRVVAGDILYAISKHATDRFNSLASDILPLVFVAKHDTYERAKTLFDDIWSENVAGTRTVLLYLQEIIELASQYLDSARWSIKHTSAFAVADVVTSSGPDISDANAKVIWPALEKALAGKTWEGKEIVLKALIQYTKHSTYWSTDPEPAEQIGKIVLRESKRNNPAYRHHALACLADFVNQRSKTDMYPQVHTAVHPIIGECLDNSEEMDLDSKSGGPSSKSVMESTLANSATALLNAINPSSTSAKDLTARLTQALELSTRIRNEHGSRKAIDAIFDAQKALFERIHRAQQGALPSPLENVMIAYTTQLFTSTSDYVEPTRTKAAEAAMALAPVARRGERTKALFIEGLATAREPERSPSVLQVLERARKVIEG